MKSLSAALLRSGLVLLAVTGAVPSYAEDVNSWHATPVRLQLKWSPQFSGAGFYVALERGYYTQAGLDVRVIDGGPAVNTVDRVTWGQVEFGVASSWLLVDRAHGRPVVALAALMQHSPYVLLTRDDGRIRHVHDLYGRTLMLQNHAEELLAYLAVEHVSLDKLNVIPFVSMSDALIAGHADAVSAYTTTGPFDLREAGVPYRVLSPRSSGLDFYGDTLFTTERMVREHRNVVEAFRKASLRGWSDALTDPDAAIDLILRKYDPTLERRRLEFEAKEYRRLASPDLVEVGYMHEGRWRAIAEAFADAGFVPADMDLKGFLYLPNAKPDLTVFWVALVAMMGLTLAVLLVSLRFRRLNRRLLAEKAALQAAQRELELAAATDSLTGLYNRRKLDEMLAREFARMKRFGEPLSVIMVDADRFKNVNDTYGHQTGDVVLKQIADLLRSGAREMDIVGRWGGEEFMIVCPGTDAGSALALADRIRRLVEEHEFPAVGKVTCSFGIADAAVRPEEHESIVRRADRALYQAKNAGRNRVALAPMGEP